jgi:hypothetical protein
MDPANRRRRIIELTDDGHRRLDGSAADVIRQVREHFDAEEFDQLVRRSPEPEGGLAAAVAAARAAGAVAIAAAAAPAANSGVRYFSLICILSLSRGPNLDSFQIWTDLRMILQQTTATAADTHPCFPANWNR